MVETCEPLPPLNIGQEATALAFSQGADLAIGDSTGLVRLWKETGKSGSFTPWKQLGVYESRIRCLQFSPLNPDLLAIGTKDGSLYVWDVGANKEIYRLQEKKSLLPPHISALAFSPKTHGWSV